MLCKLCGAVEEGDFYVSNKTKCKACIKLAVKKNRIKNTEYYREYDKRRFKNDPRVLARHKAYQSTEAGKLSLSKAKDKWAKGNAIKKGASTIVCNAVSSGKLIKPINCSECGCEPSRLHGHHDDYAKPLDVRWLCSKCHTAWHKENGEGLNG